MKKILLLVVANVSIYAADTVKPQASAAECGRWFYESQLRSDNPKISFEKFQNQFPQCKNLDHRKIFNEAEEHVLHERLEASIVLWFTFMRWWQKWDITPKKCKLLQMEQRSIDYAANYTRASAIVGKTFAHDVLAYRTDNPWNFQMIRPEYQYFTCEQLIEKGKEYWNKKILTCDTPAERAELVERLKIYQRITE